MHQNGVLLSKTSRPFTKRGSVYLTSDPEGELFAPFYPLPTDIRVFQVTKRGVEVDLDPNWEGFTTFEGKIEDINSDRKSAYTHIMKKGDYGSIAYNDLRVLIRIGRERSKKKKEATQSKEYRGKSSELWLGTKNEWKFLAIGALASSWLLGGFLFGLLNHPDNRPRDFIDLRNEYTLPFIHPKHLLNIPESLQSQYDRVLPIRSAMEFAKGFTDIAMGYDALKSPNGKHPLFQESRLLYKELFQNLSEEIQQFQETRSGLEKGILNDSRNALVSMPFIIGESFSSSLLRLEDKMKIWHQNAESTLTLRRSTTQSFASDKNYDFTEYRGGDATTKPQFFKPEMNDEEFMYDEVKTLAEFAEQQQILIRKYREKVVPVSAENSSPILLKADADFLSLQKSLDPQALNLKLSQLQASSYEPDKPKVVREPLIGTLNPRLIEDTVQRYRFELQLCYELALRRDQNLQGAMEWQWHLDTQGQVFDINLKETNIQDTKMIECIRGKIANWRWPRPQKGSIQISYPFQFRPAKG